MTGVQTCALPIYIEKAETVDDSVASRAKNGCRVSTRASGCATHQHHHECAPSLELGDENRHFNRELAMLLKIIIFVISHFLGCSRR